MMRTPSGSRIVVLRTAGILVGSLVLRLAITFLTTKQLSATFGLWVAQCVIASLVISMIEYERRRKIIATLFGVAAYLLTGLFGLALSKDHVPPTSAIEAVLDTQVILLVQMVDYFVAYRKSRQPTRCESWSAQEGDI